MENKTPIQISLERAYLSFDMTETMTVPAMEGFFSNIYNSIKDFFNFKFDFVSDTEYLNAVRHENKVKGYVSDVSYSDLAKVTMIVPKDLDVDLNEFMTTLIKTHVDLTPMLLKVCDLTETTLGLMLKAISSETPLASSVRIQESRTLSKDREEYRRRFVKMFNASRPVSQAPVVDYVKSIPDFNKVFDNAFQLKEVYTSKDATLVEARLDRITTVIKDALEELHTAESKGMKNTRGMKEMAEMTYELAKSFEFYGYLQSKVFQVYTSIENMNKNIIAELG